MDRNVIYGLWCLCHPDEGIRYVGQTSRGADERLMGHISTCRFRVSRGMTLNHSQNWIIKHGYENICTTVLEVCPTPDQLDEAERRWIDYFDGLTNIKPGGASSRGYKLPASSERLKGPGNPMWGKDRSELMDRIRPLRGPMSEEQRLIRAERLAERRRLGIDDEKRAAGIRRSHNTEEYKRAARERVLGEKNPQYGRRYTDAERASLSGLVATKMTEEKVRDIKERVRSGERQKDVAAEYGIDPSHVSKMVSGKAWSWVK